MSDWKTLDNPLLAFFENDPLAEYHFTLANQKPPKELFHYTTSDKLLGIMESQCLHGTERTYLNDEEEWSWGYSVFSRALSEMRDRLPAEVYSAILKVLENKVADDWRLYVCSFSSSLLDLRQWESYADNLKGYAIGFSGETLRIRAGFGETKPLDIDTLPKDFCYLYHLLPVVYCAEEQAKMCKAFLEVVLKWMDLHNNSALVELFVGHRLPELLISLKDPQWSSEGEWRIVRREHRKGFDKIRFRQGEYGITPYLRFNVSSPESLPNHKLPLTSMWMGSNSTSVRNSRGLKMLLESKGFEIIPSVSTIRKRAT